MSSTAQRIRFACTGCGKCCTGHHVPLTLAETRRWAQDGGQVIVLIEGFLASGLGIPDGQRTHVMRRSQSVPCGSGELQVSITFAAFNPQRCRYLDASDRCTIYDARPLVCRIYPMEINPHLPLRPENKDCPPQAWVDGPELIHGGQVLDAQLASFIEASRQADRDDIHTKVALCQALGMTTSAFKGNGFTAYLPDMGTMASILEQTPTAHDSRWSLHVEDADLATSLLADGLEITDAPPLYYAFIGF